MSQIVFNSFVHIIFNSFVLYAVIFLAKTLIIYSKLKLTRLLHVHSQSKTMPFDLVDS